MRKIILFQEINSDEDSKVLVTEFFVFGYNIEQIESNIALENTFHSDMKSFSSEMKNRIWSYFALEMRELSMRSKDQILLDSDRVSSYPMGGDCAAHRNTKRNTIFAKVLHSLPEGVYMFIYMDTKRGLLHAVSQSTQAGKTHLFNLKK